MKQDRDVIIYLKVALTIRVAAESDEDAQAEAHAKVSDEVLPRLLVDGGGPCSVVRELDRFVNRTFVAGAVRTGFAPRHLGGGVYNDEGIDG